MQPCGQALSLLLQYPSPITLIGTVTQGASRSFVVEIPDDVSVTTLDQQVLKSLADEAQIPWEFHSERFVQVADHAVKERAGSHLPIILFEKNAESPEAAA